MSKLLVVFGATGNQGGSIIDTVLQIPELSRQYSIRALTRNVTSSAAQELKKLGIEVVAADADKPETLKPALSGAQTIFSLTTTIYDEHLEEREITQGKAIADAAVESGANLLIFSTLPSIGKNSRGKYYKGGHFDCKTEVEEYIRTLPIKSAFYAPGSFMQNFQDSMKPHPAGDGIYVLANVVKDDTALPLVNIKDTGKYLAPILLNPELYHGKVVAGATKLYPMTEIVETISKVTGKTVTYKQLPEQVFRSFLQPPMADYILHMMLYFKDFGYYGAETETIVAQSAAKARGTLTTFEAFLVNNPIGLE